MTLKSKITIPLSVPVEFMTEDGKNASRDFITIKRPKLRHAKRLAVLVGPELVKALMANGEEKIDNAKLATELSDAMMKADVLDEATEVLGRHVQRDGRIHRRHRLERPAENCLRPLSIFFRHSCQPRLRNSGGHRLFLSLVAGRNRRSTL